MEKQKFSIRKMLSTDSQEWLDEIIKRATVTLSCDGRGSYMVVIVGEMDGWPFKVIETGGNLEWVWFFAASRVGMNMGVW